MSIVPNDVISQIKNKAEIADVIGSYIQLKKFGSNNFKALCPFHNEKTPSFNVNTLKQMFYCFGCHKGGDVFKFVMEKEGVDFLDALHILADKYGVLIPEENPNNLNAQNNASSEFQRTTKERLFKLNELLTTFFENNLHSKKNQAVSDYVRERHLPIDIIKKFRIGAALDAWNAALIHANESGFSAEEMVLAGAAIKKEETGHLYDRFRNRMVFPIQDAQGRIAGFSARSIDNNTKGAKYVNTPETPIFVKGRMLYALPLAKSGIHELKHVILCEGQIDVIAMHRAGFTNAVAPQGTAFTDEQSRLLKRYTDQIMVAFDSDEAGQKATRRVMELLLPLGFTVRIMPIPKGEDPDSLFNAEGYHGLQRIHKASVDFFDFLFHAYSQEFDGNSPVGITKINEKILKMISLIPNGVLRASYSSKLAQYLSLPQNAVFMELNKLRRRDTFRKRGASEDYRNANNLLNANEKNIHYPNTQIAKAEEEILEVVLSSSSYARVLAEQLPANMISDSPVGKAINKVVAMTINGEWDEVESVLKDEITLNPQPEITRIITAPQINAENEEKRNSLLEEALKSCIITIKSYYLKKEIGDVKEKIRICENDAEKDGLYRKCMKLDSDLKLLYSFNR